jgi:hypothetical protein
MPVHDTIVFGEREAVGVAAEAANEDERETRGRE